MWAAPGLVFPHRVSHEAAAALLERPFAERASNHSSADGGFRATGPPEGRGIGRAPSGRRSSLQAKGQKFLLALLWGDAVLGRRQGVSGAAVSAAVEARLGPAPSLQD